MQDESVNQFEKLVEKRSARGKIAGGEVFAFWGILNLIGYFTYFFLWTSIIVWVIMMVIGVIVQIFYVERIKKKDGYQLFWTGIINQLWLFILVLLPFLFYIFPFVFKIYSPIAIFPLIFLWLSIGSLITGLIVEQLSFTLGGLILFVSSILLVLFIDELIIIYPATITAGVIIPGIWSRYEEKK